MTRLTRSFPQRKTVSSAGSYLQRCLTWVPLHHRGSSLSATELNITLMTMCYRCVIADPAYRRRQCATAASPWIQLISIRDNQSLGLGLGTVKNVFKKVKVKT